MKTPREKYLNDAHFKRLVDTMMNQIHNCNYTPSEIREASLLASIIHEEQTGHLTFKHHKEVMDFLDGKRK